MAKKNPLSSLLYSDRFNSQFKSKKFLQRNSITEYSGLSALNEKLSIERFNSDVINKYTEIINSFDYKMSIPPRVPLNGIEKEDYKEVESFVFNSWKFEHKDLIFERNIEIWRQFWLTCERASTIVQIVDARNPEFFINEDIFEIYKNKKHVILYNKCDLIRNNNSNITKNNINSKNTNNINSYFYSTLDNSFDYKFTGTVGLIGYPNVGKSSTLNLILKQKKVKVSSTPGKTKYIQTIETPNNFTLLDCPGLVFPKHDKISLVLMGILNIDQITDFLKYEKRIVEIIGSEKIHNFYKLTKNYDDDPLSGMSLEKGWVKSKCLKLLAKDFSLGRIPY